MDDALKTQLIYAVENLYESKLRNRYTGYMDVRTHDVLDHLMYWYSNIAAANTKTNEERINEEFDHSHPIDVCFQRIDDAVQYADDKTMC